MLSSGKLPRSRAIKTQDPLGQDPSAGAGRRKSKTEAKSEPNGQAVSPVLNPTRQSVVSNYFPRAPAASHQAFRSVGGCPTKGAAAGDTSKSSASSASQRRTSSSKAALRNSVKAGESAPGAAAQGRSRAEAEPPRKQRRLEDKTVFDKFFINKERSPTGGGDAKGSAHPAAAPQSSGSSTGPIKMVPCPVCQQQVPRPQINEHLDWCLESDHSEVKRRNL